MSNLNQRERIARSRPEVLIAIESGVLVAAEEVIEMLGAETTADEFEIEVIAGRPYVRARAPKMKTYATRSTA